MSGLNALRGSLSWAASFAVSRDRDDPGVLGAPRIPCEAQNPRLGGGPSAFCVHAERELDGDQRSLARFS